MGHRSWRGWLGLGTGTLLGLLAAETAWPAEGSRAQAASLLRSDPAFEQRLTVRVTGMPLDQLFPMLSRELGVALRPATEEVGDLRVSVFVQDRPAGQILAALTAMLNLTPDVGFGWRKARRVYELYESPATRAVAAQHLRWEEEAALRSFRAQVRAMASDPQLRKLWEAPPPVLQLQRATQLLTSLTDAQLAQLMIDGVLVLRQSEVPPAQQPTLARLSADIVAINNSHPPSFPEEPAMYQDLDPARVTLTFERDWQAPDLTLMARLGLGSGKGGARYQVYPLPGGASERREPERPADGRQRNGSIPTVESPASGGPPITLRPRSWTAADLLSELARKSGRALVSDCYTQTWEKLASLPPLPLARFLERLDEEYKVRSQERDGILLMRSRRAEAWRTREVPERLISRWVQQMKQDRAISLETLTEMAQRSEAGMSELGRHPELRSALGGFSPSNVWAYKEIWRLYGLLSPAQRLAVSNGGLRLFGRQMSPPQRQQFAQWLILGGQAPDIPERAYADGEFALRVGTNHTLESTWSLGGRTTSWRHWLALDRDWITGEPRAWEPGQPESMLGRPAPPLTVRGLDGQLRTLPFPAGRSFLAYFRDTWVMPYAGRKPDTIDLDLLTGLLVRRPELRDRIAVIFPREPVTDLRKWLVESGLALPAYADETGAVTRAYGMGSLPRAVLIGPDQRVAVIRTGYDEVMTTDGDDELKR
jgi:hypothetical protein